MPSPAMLIAVIAIVLALGGTSFAAKKLLGLGAFKDGVKDKTVGVGKLRYVQNTLSVTNSPPEGTKLTAQCPSGYNAIGGGTKANPPDTSTFEQHQQYPSVVGSNNGWTSIFKVLAPAENVTVTAICARSRAVTGAPPAA